MKFLSDIRLLLLAIWLGAAVFFIGVAQSAFSVVPEREIAGAVVGRSMMLLNIGGLAIGIILLLTSMVGSARISSFWLWVERFLLLIVTAACGLQQFVIGTWMLSLRVRMAGPIDQVPADDPLRMQFDQLHHYSEWVLLAGMIAALIAFFIVARRKFDKGKTSDDVYDFSKEFKT
jgi:hypothetical protein